MKIRVTLGQILLVNHESWRDVHDIFFEINQSSYSITKCSLYMGSVYIQKVYINFEYLVNWLFRLNITYQPVRDLWI